MKWFGFAAAAWALVFAALHIAWAAGSYIGLNAEQARAAFEYPPFFAYDIVVAAMCLIAAPVALALVQPWGRRVPRTLLAVLAWTGSVLLILRSTGSIVQSLYRIATGTFRPTAMYAWELWFYIGAVLFGVITWNFRLADSPFPSKPVPLRR